MAVDDMTTSAHYQRLWASKYDWSWGAADGAGSRLAPNGARYWFWGDTIIGYPSTSGTAFDSARVMISNSIMVQRGSEVASATYGSGLPAVPDVTMNGVPRRFWTTDIIFPSMYPTKAYVLCQRIHDDMTLGFVTDGAMIAEFNFVGTDRLKFVQMWPTPSTLDLLETSEIQWAQSWEEYGGYIYIYGYKQAGAGTGFTTPHRTYVARVQARWLTNKYAWQIWTGSGWVAGATATALENAKNRAGIILDGMVTSVRYDATTARWLLAHKPWNGIGSQIDIYSAPAPQGPLTLRQSVASSGGTSPAGNPYITYNATLHNKVTLASGKYLLGISHNGGFAEIFNERSLYKPEFQEVTIP